MKKLSKKNKFLTIVGIVVFVLAFMVNIQYALDGYGISKNSLHTEVLAQTTSGTGTGSSSGGLLWHKVMTNSTCTYTQTVNVWICGVNIYYVPMQGCRESTATTTFTGKMTRCDDGWNFCSARCEGAGTSTN